MLLLVFFMWFYSLNCFNFSHFLSCIISDINYFFKLNKMSCRDDYRFHLNWLQKWEPTSYNVSKNTINLNKDKTINRTACGKLLNEFRHHVYLCRRMGGWGVCITTRMRPNQCSTSKWNNNITKLQMPNRILRVENPMPCIKWKVTCIAHTYL